MENMIVMIIPVLYTMLVALIIASIITKDKYLELIFNFFVTGIGWVLAFAWQLIGTKYLPGLMCLFSIVWFGVTIFSVIGLVKYNRKQEETHRQELITNIGN